MAVGESSAVNLLNLCTVTSDRCAAEAGQCKELQKLKEKELPLLLGQRFSSAGMGVSLRLFALAPKRCVVELKVWLPDGSAAQALIASQKLPQLLTAAVNALIGELPVAPVAWLQKHLSSGGGRGREGGQGRGRGRGGGSGGSGGRGDGGSGSTQFSVEVDRYLQRHKVVACLEAIVNQVVGRGATTPLNEAFQFAFSLDAQRLQLGPWAVQPDGGGDDADFGDAQDDAPADELTDAERDRAQQIGEWKVAGLSSRQHDLLTCIIWTNCHEHALVNAFEVIASTRS